MGINQTDKKQENIQKFNQQHLLKVKQQKQ